MNNYTDLEKAIYNALSVGYESARTRRELCRAVG